MVPYQTWACSLDANRRHGATAPAHPSSGTASSHAALVQTPGSGAALMSMVETHARIRAF